MPDIFEILTHTVEYREWHQTAVRVSVIGTAFLSLVVAHGFFRQAKNIWTARSGEGVSAVWLLYFTGMFASAVFYGIHKGSAAIIVQCGVLFVMQLPILLGLWRFKRWSYLEKTQAVIYLIPMPIAVAMTPHVELLFTAISLGAIYSTATQPFEMWKTKKAGVLDSWLVASNAASCLFWSIFAFSTGQVALMILNPPLVVLFSLTLFLWFRYRDPAKTRV